MMQMFIKCCTSLVFSLDNMIIYLSLLLIFLQYSSKLTMMYVHFKQLRDFGSPLFCITALMYRLFKTWDRYVAINQILIGIISGQENTSYQFNTHKSHNIMILSRYLRQITNRYVKHFNGRMDLTRITQGSGQPFMEFSRCY